MRGYTTGELTRFMAMPNPCGVGMALVENQSKDGNGKIVKSTVVGGMQGGLAADLSGVIKVGDELIQVCHPIQSSEMICGQSRKGSAYRMQLCWHLSQIFLI